MKPSLQTSLLRRNQGKQLKFRKERGWFRRFKQRTLIFLLVVGAGYAVYWLQTRQPFKETELDAAAQVEQFDPSLVLAHKEDLPTKDLLRLAGKMDLDTNAQLPVQIEWVQNRLNISDRLLAKTDDEVALKEGTLYRLEALQLLSNLNRKFEMGNDTVDAQLYELCEASLSHSDPEVSKIAAVAIMMTSMHQFSNEPVDANLKDAIAKCKQIARQLSDDHEIALAIFKYARLMKRANSMVDDSVHFFRIVIEQFLDSNNARAREIAVNAYRELLYGDMSGEPKFAGLLIAGINDRFRNHRETVEMELVNRVRFSMLEDLVDQDTVAQQLEFLEVLFAHEKITQANEILDELRQFYSELDDEALVSTARKTFGDFEKRLNNFGKFLDINTLTFINSEAKATTGTQSTLVMFWAANDKRSGRLLNSLKNLASDKIAQCIVAGCDLSEQDLEQFAKLAKEIPNFKFAILNRENEGDDFAKLFPIAKLPYLILLDKEWNVAGINPHPRDIADRILKLTER